MTTIGDKERNTIVFFCTDAMGVYPPEYKNSFISIPLESITLIVPGLLSFFKGYSQMLKA